MGQKRVRVKEPERDRKMTKGKHAETTHGQRTLRAVVEGENGRWKYTETPTTDSNKRNDRNNVETRERPSARITRNVRRPGRHTSVVVGIGGRRVRVALRLPLPRPRGNENVSVSSFLFCFFGFFFLPSLFSPPIFRSEKRGRAPVPHRIVRFVSFFQLNTRRKAVYCVQLRDVDFSRNTLVYG